MFDCNNSQIVIKKYGAVDVVMAALAKLKQDSPLNTTEQMCNPFHDP